MKNRKSQILLVLIIAGESIFFLPFVLARIFRPTLLGGPLADRFPARRLMSLALVMTSPGGFIMAVFPLQGIMRTVYVLWGFTTILLFREMQHFKMVLVFTSLWTLAAGILVWVFISEEEAGKGGLSSGNSLKHFSR